MVTITNTPCARTFQRLGKTLHAWNCVDCGGSGIVATRSVVPSVEIGPGTVYFSPGIGPVTQQQAKEWHMLAACLGSKTWPPEA